MKYFVFVFENYYPSGGFDDCRGAFDSEDEALCWIAENHPRLKADNIDVWALKDKEPECLYWLLTIRGQNKQTICVLGNDEQKIVKMLGPSYPQRFAPRDSIDDYKLDLFEVDKCKS